ncbi:MAG: helix-turn-helix domain-containing protein [Chthonomonas sp.]|nr:helix-turn-helix domain-containing protein [Chthonomonas sp.]
MTPPPDSVTADVLSYREVGGVQFMAGKNLPGVVKPRHSHEFAFFNFVISGSAEEIVEAGPTVLYRPFEIHFHPRHEIHTSIVGKEGNIGFAVTPRSNDLDRLRRKGVDVSSRFVMGDDGREVARHFCHAFEAPAGRAEVWLMELYEKLLDVTMASRSGPGISVQPWLIQAREIMQETFRDPKSLKEIATMVGIHPVHLAQEFKKNYAETVGEYMRRLRLEEAKYWLGSSELSIAAVSKKLGFYDHAHFVKVFRTESGMTPSMYRQLSREAPTSELV